MSTNKKYFYLKVKDTFFDSEEMKLLKTQKNGTEYQLFYLKLCLLSVKNEGALLFKDFLPYDLDMIASITDTDIDTARVAMELFKKIGLVTLSDNQVLYMSDIQSLIGHSSSEAERKKLYREKINNALLLEDKNGTLSQNVPPEIELEKDIELDLNKDIKKEKEVKHKYGEYKNILLTDKELEKLKEKFPTSYKEKIEYVSEGIELKGYKYKSHYLAILKWFKEEVKTETKGDYFIPNLKCNVCGTLSENMYCSKCNKKIKTNGDYNE